MILFESSGPCTLADASFLRKILARRLDELRLPVQFVDDLVLTFSELATNLVEHAERVPSTIGVTIRLQASGIRMDITDDGSPYTLIVEKMREARRTTADVESERGRGLQLAAQCFKRIAYTAGTPNRLSLWKPLHNKRPTILIVEDDPSLLDLYSGYLCDEYRVLAVATFEDAVEIANDQIIDVILSDVHLGQLKGTALLSALDNVGRVPTPPIVLMSGDANPGVRQDALTGGAEFFVTKPIRPRALRETISLALTRTMARRARLARDFARHVEALLACAMPVDHPHARFALMSDTASPGGGDFVIHRRGIDHERFVLVDVMGHGISAKAWAIAYASIIRALLHDRPDDNASAFLTRLANVCWTDPGLEGAMATMLVIDVFDDGSVIFASAGHPLPVLLKHGGIQRIEAHGQLLGVAPPSPYETERIEMQAGERLILVSDGVDTAEVAAGGDLPAWLIALCETENTPDIEDGQAQMRAAIVEKLGAAPADDWTVMLIERRA